MSSEVDTMLRRKTVSTASSALQRRTSFVLLVRFLADKRFKSLGSWILLSD